MTNVTVTFRRMFPREDLLATLREAGNARPDERWNVTVEPLEGRTRVEIAVGDRQWHAEHQDPVAAVFEACRALSENPAAA
ncbi:MAG: hypothetical protein AAGE52_24345 [Myxococcota bacterium]